MANRWWSAFGKKTTKNGKKPGPPVHDDRCARTDAQGRVRHQFTADRPNQLWLGDITEHLTREGKVYLCAFKDAYSNRIVGYSIDSRMKSRIAVAALGNTVARRGDVAGCVVHTDRGSQFRSRKCVHALNRHNLAGSMSKVSAAGDNAAIESLFALIQKNVLNAHTWSTREQLRTAIVTWIERTHHRRRRQDTLGRSTPIEHHDHTNQPRCVTNHCHPFVQQSHMTYVSTWSGWVYIAFVIDAFARRILGWRTGTTMNTPLVLEALEQAVWTRGQAGADLAGLVAHTDQGVQGGFNWSPQHVAVQLRVDACSRPGWECAKLVVFGVGH